MAGLHRHLTSTGFLADLVTVKDVLCELQSLSLKLQKLDTSLVDASRHIHQTIEVLCHEGPRGENRIQSQNGHNQRPVQRG